MNESSFIQLNEGNLAQALVAPELGGWLLRYARSTPRSGMVEAIHFSQEVVDRYPLKMYAGNPLLFPFVSFNHLPGREHHYEWEGRVFPMPQHGFARRSKWSVLSRSETAVTMELRDSPETRQTYPFSFSHQVTYELRNGRLWFRQKIENRSEVPLPFSVGIHPYCRVPLTPSGERNACHVVLPDARRRIPENDSTRFASEPFPAQHLPLAQDVSGTLLLSDLKTPQVALVDPGAGLQTVLNWEEAPQYRFLALWSPSAQDPFYCIEPWTALPNSFARRDDKELTLLKPGEVFQAAIWMDVQPLA